MGEVRLFIARACAIVVLIAPALAIAADAERSLRSAKASDRVAVLEDLRYGKAQVSRQALEAALGAETNPALRRRLLQTLSAREGASAIPVLAAALKTETEALTRVVAAQELGRFGSEAEAGRALIEVLRADRDADVRKACAASLAFQRTPEAVNALAASAGDPDPGMRRQAAAALSRQPKSRAVDAALKKARGGRKR